MSIKAILLDSREPNWIHKLEFGGALKSVTALDYGDAWITTDTGDLVCIERKTPTDLLGSIKDNRLFAQLAGMRQRTPWAYLVITGVLTDTVNGMVVADERVTGWRWESVQGALLSAQETGVPIIYCRGDQDYEATICRLCGRERCKERVLEPTTQPRVMSPGEIMLTSLPGIGMERAQILLREFDNKPCDALAWLTWHRWDNGHPILGISTGIKLGIRTALKLDDSEIIDIVPDEALQRNGTHDDHSVS